METVQLNCRNFKCRMNNSGSCLCERITLTPQGSIVSQVQCIDATEREPGDEPMIKPYTAPELDEEPDDGHASLGEEQAMKQFGVPPL